MVKQKTIVTLVVAASLMLALFSFARSCRATAQLETAKAEYAEYRAVVDANNEIMSNRVDELNKSIVLKDKAIVSLEFDVAAKDLDLRAARQELTDLQNEEPPTTPDIEALPIVINLRGQVAKVTEMFTLSTEALTLRDREIAELKGKVILIEQVAAEWKAGFEREHALRVAAEGLFKKSERARESNRTIKNIALGIAGAGVLYGLLK